MKYLLPLLGLALWLPQVSRSQDATGIKIANLADADLELMDNHDPASELANFELLPDFEVNLFAADPMLANPIHMHWDSKGRLWVACSWAYPQLKPGEVANDKIIILEDTDGDGSADKSTVFADGLYLPTGIELANGGCYVAQSPDVFFLKDTDGDDVADVKELALTGFGIEDSHHSISAWRRGPGGWIYFQEGIFLHSQVETQHGVVRNFNGGVYQYNPRTGELRLFCGGTGGNPWGHVFDQWGQSFMVNNPRIMYLTPGTGAVNDKPRASVLISTEKQCGGDLVSGTHLPDDMQGQLLTCRFKSRTVVRYELLEDGAGFTANVLEPLIKSKHPNFRPVDVKIGPDGAVYVADWYNSIINHAQHDFRDPRRDHEHGRIWRIKHKTRPLVPKPTLDGIEIAALVEHLGSPNIWTRHQARKELSEHEPDQVHTAVEGWVHGLDPILADYDRHLVEALWACQNVERPSEEILQRVLSAGDGHARSAGARVIRYWHAALTDPVAMIAKAASDPFPRTRMEAVLSAGFIPRADAFTAALNVLDHARDPFIDAAIPQTVDALRPYWQPALEKEELVFTSPAHREFAEQSAGLGFDKLLLTLFKNPSPTLEELENIKGRFVKEANVDHVRMVIDAVPPGKIAAKQSTRTLLEAMQIVGSRGKLKLPRRLLSALIPILSQEDDAIVVSVAANFGAWKATQAADELLRLLRDHQRSLHVRGAAAMALGSLGKTEIVSELKLLANSGDVESRYLAMKGLVVADLVDARGAVSQLLTVAPGRADPAALVQDFLQRRGGDAALASALEGIDLHPDVVSAVSEYHRQSGQLPKILEPYFQGSASSSLNASLSKEDRVLLTADAERLGDAFRGELIYRRKTLACGNCHGIGPVGPVIGPNLVAVGAAAKTEYLVQSLLEPNAAIAEHYENMMFVLEDGSVRSGVITYKSEREVVIRDTAQKGLEVTIPATDILQQKGLPSLMPAGLADQLASRQEFLDLVKFLSMLGRPGPFANDESPVIRKWRIHNGDQSDSGINGGSIPDSDAAWHTAYCKVDGELPAADFGDAAAIVVRGFVNCQVAGRVHLEINDLAGLQLWVDGERLSLLTDDFQLERGRHALTFVIDRAARGQQGLRVEVVSSKGSPVKFQPEGGL